MKVLGRPGWLVSLGESESSQHLSQLDWDGRGWEEVEVVWHNCWTVQLWFFNSLHCRGNVLAYVLLKTTSQGTWWVLPGQDLMCPIGSCSNSHPMYFFFPVEKVGYREEPGTPIGLPGTIGKNWLSYLACVYGENHECYLVMVWIQSEKPNWQLYNMAWD